MVEARPRTRLERLALRQRSRRRWMGLAVVLTLIVAGSASTLVWRWRADQARLRRELVRAAASYLAAWQTSDWPAMEALLERPSNQIGEAYGTAQADLHVSGARYALASSEVHGSSGRATFDATLDVEGLGQWTYRGSVPFVRQAGRWVVRWSPAAVHPALRQGLALRRTRVWPQRAPIEDREGAPLTVPGPVVTVGIQLGRVQDRDALTGAVTSALDVTRQQVRRVLATPEAKPTWFLPLITLRRSEYRRVEGTIHDVPGLVFRPGTARVLRAPGFARHVVGSTDEVTAELLDRLGAPYLPGDVVGRSGLERRFEEELAGSPSGEIDIIDGAGTVQRVLHRFAGTAPEPIRTTIDVNVQAAAEAALKDVGRPAALVAVDTRTGDIRAAVSRPLDQENRAFLGQYPPGSTFKIVTAAALLAAGHAPGEHVTCPATVRAGGKVFRNFEGEALGTITLAQAFAHSCNTAFIQLAQTLERGDLGRAAGEFGFDTGSTLPLDAVGGDFPEPADDAEAAAAAIGQGRILASPLLMATVAAAVASGEWRAPRLLDSDPPVEPASLEPDVADTLAGFMRMVVTEGTAAGAGLPPGVAGKTGTAEFGSGSRTHAWFVGFQGRLAFAVFVEGGGAGGPVAAPIAAAFLRGLG